MDKPVRELDNKNAWFLALFPLIVVVFILLAAAMTVSAPSAFSLVVPPLLVWQDRKSLKAHEIEKPPSFWWFIIPMVYLWKRANLLDGNKILAWLWLGSWVASVVILASLGLPASD